jgi:hypothetical protein
MRNAILKYVFIALVVGFTSFGGDAEAATIWDETIDGNLDGTSGTSLGALGVGTFFVHGKVTSGGALSPTQDKGDFFNWSLVGSKLQSVKLTYWSTSCGPCDFIIRVANSPTTTPMNEFALGNIVNRDLDLFSLAGVSKDGSFFSSGTRIGTGTNSYTFEITTVSAIPLPAGFPLLLGGLGALAFVFRRNKQQS